MSITKTLDITVSSVTVTCKDGQKHIKFLLVDGLIPFPDENFILALGWAAEGLLGIKAVRFLEAIKARQPLVFRADKIDRKEEPEPMKGGT